MEDIEVGDKVLAKSDETGEVAYKEVVGLFQKQADEIYYVHIGDEIIKVTGEHPFWLDGAGWTLVKDLKVGDLLVSSDGSTLPIDKIEKEPRQATVYNFEVAEFNSYFVSNLEIWVHNCATNFKNYSAKEMERKFKLKKGEFHQIKQDIIKDLMNKQSPYKNQMKKVGSNPDIHLSSDGTIRIMSRDGKTSFDTDWNINSFLP
ncbi:polymorphic toxin-type HINT domain-containing protein [Paenibacillus lutimineralis]|uniref:polymorphic toxin-type HINT domain-containing protein n=1 Tax=Paenibacillus lutimineralis TaxID=2707005 RepID=UPI003AB53E4F